MDNPDALVLLCHLVANFSRTIGTAVVNSNDLETVEVLSHELAETAFDVGLLVINGYDD
jgi:hypothetical protein